MEFTAVKTFHCPELKSDYVAGLSYTARSPDARDVAQLAKSDPKRAALLKKNRATLAKLLPGWLKSGQVVAGRVSAPGTVSGGGEVH